MKITTDSGHDRVVGSGGRVTFEIEVSNCADVPSATCGVAISNDRGNRVAFFHTLYHGGFRFAGTDKAKLVCTVPSLPLVPACYQVELVLADENKIIEKVERADRLDVVFADLLGTGKIPNNSQGVIVMPAEWDVDGTPVTERLAPTEKVGELVSAARLAG